MPYTVDPAVRKQVVKSFSSEKWDYVLMALERTILPGLDRYPLGVTRVHLAALHLSYGELKTFETELKEATRDWRDTLIAADLAYDNWPEVLKKRGIEL
jgi:hypothetical protein